MIWELFERHKGRLIDKWRHYFPIYDRHFERFRYLPNLRVLEIGVGHGGSLQLWKSYFPDAQIVGLDIDPRCKEYEESRITIHTGDQANPPMMGHFDIVIDDGSHRPNDQSASFTKLWPQLNAGGIYLIEDCHHHFPSLLPVPPITYTYPWVMVCEKPQRVVAGNPSRPLNTAEVAAYG